MSKDKEFSTGLPFAFVVHTLPMLIKYGAYVAIVYISKDAAVALAGKTTIANIVVQFSQHYTHNTDEFVLSGLLGFTVALYFRERNLRYRKTKVLGKRILELEKNLDPERTTSGLTLEGKTNPEDPQ